MTVNVKLRADNAPSGLPTCPNCARREKADPGTWDTAGGDFWWCLAEPILPAFTGLFLYGQMKGRIGQPINLALFDPASRQSEHLNGKRCPLFEPHA